MLRRARAILAFGSLLTAALPVACGPVTRVVTLDYPDALELGGRELPPALVPEETLPVRIGIFEDRRRFPDIADVRTADQGRHFTRVFTDVPVGEWVAEGVAWEYARAGVEVLRPEDVPPRALLVSGLVHDAYASRRFFYEGSVRITGTVRCSCHGRILLSRKYLGQTSLPRDAAPERPAAEVLAETLSEALQRAALLFVADASRIEGCS